MTEVYDFYKFQNPEEGLAGGLMYKQVERHSLQRLLKPLWKKRNNLS